MDDPGTQTPPLPAPPRLRLSAERANAERRRTAGETRVPPAVMSAVISPRIARTTIISMSVNPASLAGVPVSECEIIEAQHGHKQRSDYAGDDKAHHDRDDGYTKRNEAL